MLNIELFLEEMLEIRHPFDESNIDQEDRPLLTDKIHEVDRNRFEILLLLLAEVLESFQ